MAPSPTAASLPARPYYPALTGLRAVAAYLIFFMHFWPVGAPIWVQRILGQMYLGVSMFFVLSGFVIATRYQGSVAFTGTWWRHYLWRRVARIYPVYLLLNGLLLAHLYWPPAPGEATRSLGLVFLSQSLLRGFSSTLKFVGIPQSWSLTAEECFYFSAPLLLWMWQRWGRAGAAGFAGAIVGTGLLLTLLCAGHPALHGFFGSYYHLFNYTFFGRVLEFLLGVGLARWWAARTGVRPTQWPWRTLLGGLLMCTAVGLLAELRSPRTFADGLLHPGAIVLNNVFFPLGVTLLLAGLLAERSWLRVALASRLMQALGRSSYFFYLVHVGVFSIWWQGQFRASVGTGWQFLATVAVAELGYRFLEEPLRRWVLARALAQPVGALRV
ncbi:acyltransferase family protein [Hymenobacter negativus]|uniref:Acyltransferase n=1 Tax=Hymenobacter negativus TaxID=2795026 RepID=A0ABS3QCA1_9BACT|nr:acyltransferase [Hymenobacter negativus]MBO2008863.1 acyltransferase [Hymenobacter negativus]